MRIAVIAPTEIPALRANTIQVMKMAQAFVQLGHEVNLASPFSGKGKPNLDYSDSPDRLWEELKLHYGLENKFPIEWLPARNNFRRYDYGFSSYQWAKRIGAELIYTRLPQSAAISSTLGRSTILEVHDRPQGHVGKCLFNQFIHGRGAERLVIITQSLANDLIDEFDIPRPISIHSHQPEDGKATTLYSIIAPDGVDLERFQNIQPAIEARKSLANQLNVHLPEDSFVAGYCGHLYAGRGIGLILSIAETLPKVNFLLVGGEPVDVSRLKEVIEHRKLKNVIITGFVPNTDLPLYQSLCDVFLMPYQHQVSASSGGDISNYLSPMKLFEYMACRRAILSSDLPVFREILNEDNAVLIQPEDTEAWVIELKRLQQIPEARKRLAAQAHKDVQKYTWRSRAEYILQGLW